MALTTDQQDAILTAAADRPPGRPADERGLEFFELIREYTVMGFYTSRVGMQQLDNPQLERYREMPGCPHHDDPEHRNLDPKDGAKR